MFNASFNRTGVTPSPGATYDPTSGTLTVTAAASYTPQFMKLAGVSTMHISVTSKAKLGGTRTWPVCVLITNPTSSHTLLVQSGATIDFTNCMVQVNTANWDAVEARDTSYIHSTNGVNCFTGDIHYGDVTPPKEATCTMLPDPYASYVVPSNNPCTYTNKQVNNTSTTLTPGTYCGGIKIYRQLDCDVHRRASITSRTATSRSPTAPTSTGNGVTFLISGQNSNLNFTTSGTITMSPYTDSSAGQWAGMLFFWDQPSTSKGSTETFSNGTMTFSGIMYFVGQTLAITNNATVTVSHRLDHRRHDPAEQRPSDLDRNGQIRPRPPSRR